LIYPEGDNEEENSFGDLMMRVLVKGILPLAGHYFQGYFLPCGPTHQAYCQLFKDFVKEHGTSHQKSSLQDASQSIISLSEKSSSSLGDGGAPMFGPYK
jgi:hypothetical protein